MSGFFKWNMLFTSFLPIWVSIIVSDIWAVVSAGHRFVKGVETLPVMISTLVYEAIKFVGSVPIQLISIFILLLNIMVSTHHIAREIKLQ